MCPSQAGIHSASWWVEPRRDSHPVFICPDCRTPLEVDEGALVCCQCGHGYPILEGIPDFVRGDLSAELRLSTRLILPFINLISGFYETRLWYPPFLRIVGGPGAPTFRGLTEIMLDKMDFPTDATILDAACGPITWGRRVASPERCVYGVDLSWPMLRRGQLYLAAAHAANVHLAHSRVEQLPFRDSLFDGLVCGGALHLVPDTVRALKEFARVMKPGARLVVMTFTHGAKGLLSGSWIRRHMNRDAGLHIFDLGELAEDLSIAGFKHFDPVVHGSVLVFTAERCA